MKITITVQVIKTFAIEFYRLFQYRGHQIGSTRTRILGQQTRLHSLRNRFGHWSRQRLAVSLPLLQKWRWRFSYPLLPYTYSCWYSNVLHGIGYGTNAYHWRAGCVQDCTDFQRYVFSFVSKIIQKWCSNPLFFKDLPKLSCYI